MSDEPRRLKYSDSPFAPDWARKPKTPETISDAPMREMTSFGKPIPEAPEPEGLRAHFPPQKPENNAAVEETEAFRPTIEQIEEILWKDANDDLRVYCIIDGYWAYGLYGRLLNSPDISWAHMFQGDVATKNVQQAPFIIALKRGHKLTRWLIEEGWGQGWGIYFTASTRLGTMLYGSPRIHDTRFLPSNEEQLKLGNLVEGPEDPLWKMRRHFRSFSDVYLESINKIVDFRYYDPWVTASYLMFSGHEERRKFLDPVTYFVAEMSDYIITNPDTSAYYYILDSNGVKINNIKGGESTFISYKIEKEEYVVETPICYTRISAQKYALFTGQIDQSILRYTENTIKNVMQTHQIQPDKAYLEKFCAKAARAAEKIGLVTLDERIKFTLCSVWYGFGFEQKDPVIGPMIKSGAPRPAAINRHLTYILAKGAPNS